MKFPRCKNEYVITAAADPPDNTTIYDAKYVDPNTGVVIPVGIKILNTNKIENIYSFTTQLHLAEVLDHANLIKVHCSFKESEDHLWVIMSQPGLSVRSVIRNHFPRGLPKSAAAYILKETLKGLHFMHEKNKFHENINGGCIFLGKGSGVKLGYDYLVHEEDIHRSNWIPASLLALHFEMKSSKSTDVWMFGLLALELFYGGIPASDLEEFDSLMSWIQYKFGRLRENERMRSGCFSCFHDGDEQEKIPKVLGGEKKKIPKVFGEVVAACLWSDPKRRPTTTQLMHYAFFQDKFSAHHRRLDKLIKIHLDS